MKKYKLMLAAPPKLQDLAKDIEKISQLAEEEVYIQVTERCSDIEQLKEWISEPEKEEINFLLLFNLVEDRINQEQGSLEILEALRTIRFSTHSKTIMILAKKHESSAIWLNFVNELMKLNVQNFYFADEFTTEDLKFWLEQEKTLSDNQKYIRVGNDSSAKEQELEKKQKEIQEEKKQLQEKEKELEQIKLQMQEQIKEAEREKEKEQPLIQQENSEPQEAQAPEQTQAEINALQQKWEEERQELLQQSQQEKEELLQKTQKEKELLLRRMQEAEQKGEPKESRLPPFMGGNSIGLMNLSHGAGSTTTAIKLANWLSVFGKTAVIAFDGKEDLLYADKKSKIDYIVPSIGRKKEELVKALQMGYSFILLDFGNLLDISPSGQINSSYLVDRQEDVQEFLRCQYKIVLSFSANWHIGKLQYFQQNNSLFDLEHFAFGLSGENRAEIRSLKSQMYNRDSDDLIKTLGSQMGLQIEQKKRRGK